MTRQLEAERAFQKIAESTGRESVILLDRSSVDIMAYVPEDIFAELLEKAGTSMKKLLEANDLVLHFVTTALGRARVYNKEQRKNRVRKETAAEARALDEKMKHAYEGANVVVLNNDENWASKQQRAVDAVVKLVTR